MTLSRKGATSGTRVPALRSTGAKARTPVDGAHASNANLEKKLAEALEQQAATSEVLSLISSSPENLELVFKTILANATRLCEAKFGTLYLYDGDAFRAVAFHNAPPAYVEHRKRGQIRPSPGTALGRLRSTKQVVHIADITAEQAYTEGDPFFVTAVGLGGYRTLLSVPMLKESDLIGSIAVFRQEVRPFTDKHIELVSNFAKQAVIAIENARLLNELRQRTDDLSELLEQQTAASQVLQVISNSTGELEPVFQAILASATRTCDAKFALLYRIKNGAARIISKLGIPPAFAEYLKRGPHRPPLNRVSPLTPIGRVIQSRQLVHIADYRADPGYLHRDPLTVAGVELGGVLSGLVVPMIKNDALMGAFAVFRQEVRPFTGKQIDLVQNFAKQAVIAIENTRLLNELRELLQQQTATADVLKVISRSTFDLQVVLDTLVELAVRLCEAESGTYLRRMKPTYELGGLSRLSRSEFEEYMRRRRSRLDADSLVGRIALEGRTVHIPDILADPEYERPERSKTWSVGAL